MYPVPHFSWYFAKQKIQKISKHKTPFCLFLLTAGCCEEELYLVRTCGIGVWEKETLVVYLLRIWQPSRFLCSLPLILCQFYLRFPYQLTSAMAFVLWHIIEKMESLEWTSLPLSLTITLSSEAVSMLSVCSQVLLPLYLTAILGALKAVPLKDDKESRVS